MGYYRYLITLRKHPHGLEDLVVRTALDRDGATSPLELAGSGGPNYDILISRVKGVRWSYLAPPSGSAPDSSQPTWVDAWHRDKLPLLVRLRVTFSRKDARVWPEFLAHPRITDDAQCQFDAIAQVCRPVHR